MVFSEFCKLYEYGETWNIADSNIGKARRSIAKEARTTKRKIRKVLYRGCSILQSDRFEAQNEVWIIDRFFDYNAPIKPLSNPKAVEMGGFVLLTVANFLSEVLIFGVAAACVVGEAIRSNNSSNNKQKDVKDRLQELEAVSVNLEVRVKELESLLATSKKEP